jgi:predicted nucleic acid-binding protein
VDSPVDADLFESAVDLYRAARRTGLTIRSSVDCLIAASAIRHGLQVIHRDRDYTALAKVAALQQRAV